MSPSTPFVDGESGALDTEQMLAEAVPLAKLVGLVVAVALVPFAFAFLVGSHGGVGVVLALAGQFVLAVGSGLVLMYVVARAVQLADDEDAD